MGFYASHLASTASQACQLSGDLRDLTLLCERLAAGSPDLRVFPLEVLACLVIIDDWEELRSVCSSILLEPLRPRRYDSPTSNIRVRQAFITASPDMAPHRCTQLNLDGKVI